MVNDLRPTHVAHLYRLINVHNSEKTNDVTITMEMANGVLHQCRSGMDMFMKLISLFKHTRTFLTQSKLKLQFSHIPRQAIINKSAVHTAPDPIYSAQFL